jgi:hypothetical protein
MPSALSRIAVVAPVVSALHVSACGDPPPCDGIKVGDRFAITVIDTYVAPGYGKPYDAGLPEVCGFGMDVFQGQTLVATVTENEPTPGGLCMAATVRFEPFTGWTWTLNNHQSGSTQFILSGEYDATNGVCTGWLQVTFKVSNGADPFAPSVPGKTPNVVMNRMFSGAEAGCPRCSGDFVVNLKRL